MTKPGYGMIYAIIAILGILAVALLNRALNSAEIAPAAQVGVQRNEAVAEAAEARHEKEARPAVAEDREGAAPRADKPEANTAAGASTTTANADEEERK